MPGHKDCSIHFFAALAAMIAITAGLLHRVVSAASTPAEDSSMPVLTASSFGFQCGTGMPTNCPNVTWPTSIAQPGLIRLWDSQVQWHALNTGPAEYRWKTLDAYLDAIAAHQPRQAMYTFGYTPCWDAKGECRPHWGSSYPPKDLDSSGSQSFNSFVTALVGHCSPAGNCVKNYIKYWELWNEANAEHYWSGTITQLYSLMAPGVAIIRQNIPGALVLTPPANRGDTDWMQSWLREENTRGRLSDIFSFHLYLQGQTPETRYSIVRNMVQLKNKTEGWTKTPWMNTETNFEAKTYMCNDRYTPEDCAGQMVRWHVLHFAGGAENLSWFFFNTTIGHNSDYSRAYHDMMQSLIGSRFTAECSNNSNVYSCPFVQSDGHRAMLIWKSDGAGTYNLPSGYARQFDLSGSSSAITGKQPIPISGMPIIVQAGD